jgi:hypothetical protein
VGTLFLGSVNNLRRAHLSDDVGHLLADETPREDSGGLATTSGSGELKDLAQTPEHGKKRALTPPALRGPMPGVNKLAHVVSWADAQESAARLKERWAHLTGPGKKSAFTSPEKKGARGKTHLQMELMLGSEKRGEERLEQPLLNTPERSVSVDGGGGWEKPALGQLEGDDLVGTPLPAGEVGPRVTCRCQVRNGSGADDLEVGQPLTKTEGAALNRAFSPYPSPSP